MASLRTRNAGVLSKIESVEGVFESMSAGSDGVLVENPQITFNPQNTETNEVTGSLDGRGPIIGGLQTQISFSVYLKGDGTPGVAPEFGTLLKVSGWGESVLSASISGTTIAANGSTGQFTDSGSGLAALTVGTAVFVSGFSNSANNGEFRVTVSTAGAITVTKADGSAHGLVTESAGATITLRRGVVGTAATAGTTTSFTGGAAFSSTAQIYRGMPCLIGGNPATPAWATVIDYTSGKVATLGDLFGSALTTSSIVSIPANVLYAPISASIPTASTEIYMDGVLYRFRGVRGSVSFEKTASGAARANFTMTGLFVSKTDAAVPAITYDGTRPGTFRNSVMKVNRVNAALNSFTINANNNLVYPGDPNQSEGFGVPEITQRTLDGRIDPLATLVATRDIMTDFRNGNEKSIISRLTGGTAVAGNRIALTVPSAFYTGYQPGDRDGLATEDVNFFCRGQDSGAFLCIY